MTLVDDDFESEEEVDLSLSRATAHQGRWSSAGVPGEAVERLQERAAPADDPCSARAASCFWFRVRARGPQRRVQRLPVRAFSATATNIIVQGYDDRKRRRTSRVCTRRWARRSAVYLTSALLSLVASYLLAGVIQGLMSRPAFPRWKTRSMCCRSPTSTSNRRGDLLEPGHQRHRQRRAELAAGR